MLYMVMTLFLENGSKTYLKEMRLKNYVANCLKKLAVNRHKVGVEKPLQTQVKYVIMVSCNNYNQQTK